MHVPRVTDLTEPWQAAHMQWVDESDQGERPFHLFVCWYYQDIIIVNRWVNVKEFEHCIVLLDMLYQMDGHHVYEDEGWESVLHYRGYNTCLFLRERYRHEPDFYKLLCSPKCQDFVKTYCDLFQPLEYWIGSWLGLEYGYFECGMERFQCHFVTRQHYLARENALQPETYFSMDYDEQERILMRGRQCFSDMVNWKGVYKHVNTRNDTEHPAWRIFVQHWISGHPTWEKHWTTEKLFQLNRHYYMLFCQDSIPNPKQLGFKKRLSCDSVTAQQLWFSRSQWDSRFTDPKFITIWIDHALRYGWCQVLERILPRDSPWLVPGLFSIAFECVDLVNRSRVLDYLHSCNIVIDNHFPLCRAADASDFHAVKYAHEVLKISCSDISIDTIRQDYNVITYLMDNGSKNVNWDMKVMYTLKALKPKFNETPLKHKKRVTHSKGYGTLKILRRRYSDEEWNEFYRLYLPDIPPSSIDELIEMSFLFNHEKQQ